MTQGYSLQALAALTGSQLSGVADLLIVAVASVEQAQAGDISYIRDGKYRHYLQSTRASALILTPELAEGHLGPCLINRDPYLTYAKVVTLFHSVQLPDPLIHPTAVVADDAQLGEGVSIGAGCVVGNGCRIGEHSRLYPNVTLGDGTQLGKRVIIHAGAVLGADGFGFAPDKGEWFKIPQVGHVVLGDDVEVGANTCIDRAAMGSTRIGDGVKLDNLIQIGHNVQIGAHTAVAACTAIAGSAVIGRYCRIGGACAIAGHLSIADNVTITGMTLVSHSIHQTGMYSSGVVQDENHKWRKNAARFNQLDTMYRRLLALEKQLAEITLRNDKDKG